MRACAEYGARGVMTPNEMCRKTDETCGARRHRAKITFPITDDVIGDHMQMLLGFACIKLENN